jgi:hypothetical protein
MKALARISFPGANRLDSTTRTKAVVLPHTEEAPTLEELLSMFQEDTQVGDNPLAGVLDDSDILEETYVVNEEELLTMSDEVTQVTPPAIQLQVYYHRCPCSTDADLIPDFAWSIEHYLFGTTEAYVCQRVIDGFTVQVYRTSDGFIAQPIAE